MSQDLITDDDVLRFTQSQRKRFLDELIKDGLPKDTDGQRLFLDTLNDMDRTALGKKRVGAAEKLAASDQLVADAVLAISRKFEGRDPHRVDGPGTIIEHEIREDRLLPRDVVDGDTHIGIESNNFDDFVKKFEPE